MNEQIEKQAIEEMAKIAHESLEKYGGKTCHYPRCLFKDEPVYCDECTIVHELYSAGYRKQSEGEWIDSLKGYCQCSNCRTSFETLPTAFLFKLNNRFCRHCGAKMKGE